jgi:Uma2 family endonuclease
MVAKTRKTGEEVLLEDPYSPWEVFDGRLVEKPIMPIAHDYVQHELYDMLRAQVPKSDYWVRQNFSRLRRTSRNYMIPDVVVIPLAERERDPSRWSELAVYDRPLPLVVEIWSPSTGRYDRTFKLAEYRRRGDLEIWFIHPRLRTLTIWRRRDDGDYDEEIVTSGTVRPVALPGVEIDLDALLTP